MVNKKVITLLSREERLALYYLIKHAQDDTDGRDKKHQERLEHLKNHFASALHSN